MSKPVIVGLVDDHVLLRKGLASLLVDNGYPLVIQADNGKQFIDKLSGDEIPNIVLLDINMPVMDGYATAIWLKEHYPQMKILALSMYDDEHSIIRMLRNGAGGYILKDCEPAELKIAIEAILQKGYYHNELVSSKLIHTMQNADNGSARNGYPELSTKEVKFLQLICSEMTYKEISAVMKLSPRTIDGYRDALFEKLGIKSRVGLVMFAIRNHLINV
ncbi:MAG: response regulator transcription factor [Chitinophagaceae bacterium]|nr:response regulator transcription factor [Chitinophagaceae bacterium]